MTQSPFGRSRRLTRVPTLRRQRSWNSSGAIPSDFAIRSISSALTHTTPGSPRQQSPHRWHSNLKPFAYQGAGFAARRGCFREVSTRVKSYRIVYSATTGRQNCACGLLVVSQLLHDDGMRHEVAGALIPKARYHNDQANHKRLVDDSQKVSDERLPKADRSAVVPNDDETA